MLGSLFTFNLLLKVQDLLLKTDGEQYFLMQHVPVSFPWKTIVRECKLRCRLA